MVLLVLPGLAAQLVLLVLSFPHIQGGQVIPCSQVALVDREERVYREVQ